MNPWDGWKLEIMAWFRSSGPARLFRALTVNPDIGREALIGVYWTVDASPVLGRVGCTEQYMAYSRKRNMTGPKEKKKLGPDWTKTAQSEGFFSS